MARNGGSRLTKVVIVVAAVLVIAFIVIQFWRIDTTPIPIVQAETIQSGITVPPDVDMVLTRSCGDCHSNATVYPWYSQMQPVAWWLSNHI
ncbi:MAG TPA: heme-binding domain-containing protein, partial [Pyrinomonadaceae bacterium]|nr:heme-binding domain-containing protein [Pyrinomonadaceae bacterium]